MTLAVVDVIGNRPLRRGKSALELGDGSAAPSPSMSKKRHLQCNISLDSDGWPKGLKSEDVGALAIGKAERLRSLVKMLNVAAELVANTPFPGENVSLTKMVRMNATDDDKQCSSKQKKSK